MRRVARCQNDNRKLGEVTAKKIVSIVSRRRGVVVNACDDFIFAKDAGHVAFAGRDDFAMSVRRLIVPLL
jgi:hypothetical protein